jgi:predicted Zn-dependent peptidase
MSSARLLAAMVACTQLLAAAVAAESTLDDPALRTGRTTLENGLTVLTLEDHTTPVVSFQMWVRVGSRDESRVTGLAHLFEHMMFKGSTAIPPEQYSRILEARGARTNAYTTRDVTVYTEDITSELLPLVIALEAERVGNLDINAKTLVDERKVVLEERRMRTDDNPTGRAIEALLALTFQAHPYRWPVVGWHSDIANTTVEACRAFFDAYYVPNNITLVIVGAFDSDAAIEQIREAFGPLPRAASIPRNSTEEPKQTGPRRATVYYDVRSPTLAGAWHAPPSGHADSTALDVLSEILSGGRSSRLYRRLIHEEQIALSAHGGYWEMADAGVFYALASVRPDGDIDQVEQLFGEEIARLRDEPVLAAELAKAKRQMEVSLVHQLATNRALGDRIGYDVVVLGEVRPLAARLEAIRSVTAADVQRVAQTYLIDDGRNTVQLMAAPQSAAAAGKTP